VPGCYLEIGFGGVVGLADAPLPVPQRLDGDVESGGELLLTPVVPGGALLLGAFSGFLHGFMARLVRMSIAW
jgi:hypothetical protein